MASSVINKSTDNGKLNGIFFLQRTKMGKRANEWANVCVAWAPTSASCVCIVNENDWCEPIRNEVVAFCCKHHYIHTISTCSANVKIEVIRVSVYVVFKEPKLDNVFLNTCYRIVELCLDLTIISPIAMFWADWYIVLCTSLWIYPQNS